MKSHRRKHGGFMDKITSSVGKFRNTAILVIVPVAVLVLALGYWYARTHTAPAVADIREFAGVVTSAADGTVLMNGYYLPQDRVPQNLRFERSLPVKAGEDTRFQKIVMKLPPEEEVMKAGGTFRLEDLATSTELGSFEDLQTAIGQGQVQVEAYFPSTIIGVSNPAASQIVYRVLSFSGRVTPPASE